MGQYPITFNKNCFTLVVDEMFAGWLENFPVIMMLAKHLSTILSKEEYLRYWSPTLVCSFCQSTISITIASKDASQVPQYRALEVPNCCPYPLTSAAGKTRYSACQLREPSSVKNSGTLAFDACPSKKTNHSSKKAKLSAAGHCTSNSSTSRT